MTAERVYAALLHLYPASFRREYGGEMIAALREVRRRRRHAVALWRFVLADLVRSASVAWLDEWRHGPQRMALRLTASGVIGLAATVAAAHLTTWAYRYFYHPYLEGTAIPALPYGLALGLVLGGSVGGAQWALLPRRVRRASGWALASALALPIAVLFCGAAVDRALAGFDPIAMQRPHAALDLFIVGIDRAISWTDLALQFAAMALSSLAVRTLMRKPLMEGRHAH